MTARDVIAEIGPDVLTQTTCPIEMLSEGRKDDTGKDPWGLAPWDAFRAIVRVLRYGAAKYAPRNWEKGMAWSRPFDALMRHLTAWWDGEQCDEETGMSHLWHAGCCVVFLIAFELRGVGRDDRPTITAAQAEQEKRG
jgi:hypothetical protein